MSARWESYVACIDDRPAYVTVDLSWRDRAPLPELPDLHWIRVPIEVTGAALDPAAVQTLDALRAAFAAGNAVEAGTITAANRREVYWYAPAELDASHVRATLEAAPIARAWTHHSQPDPSWQHYGGVLLPTAEDLRRLQIARALVELGERGDALEVVRCVEYRVNFAQRSDLDLFLRQSAAAGYGAAKPPLEVEGAWRGCVSVDHALVLEVIDGHLRFLSTLTEALGGRLEGWNTHAVHLRAPQ